VIFGLEPVFSFTHPELSVTGNNIPTLSVIAKQITAAFLNIAFFLLVDTIITHQSF